ncbi:hypothetical protein PCLA_09f0082 [Pseudomonas citronellolis]|nr:hypothetical protein PCLA_09f0082 [Pseudomonas citronellolis]
MQHQAESAHYKAITLVIEGNIEQRRGQDIRRCRGFHCQVDFTQQVASLLISSFLCSRVVLAQEHQYLPSIQAYLPTPAAIATVQ